MRSMLMVILAVTALGGTLKAADEVTYLTEVTRMDIPIVGKITTQKTTYIADCYIREDRVIKVHNMLARMFSDGGKTSDIKITDLCNEVRYDLDLEASEYEIMTFEELMADDDNSDSSVDIEVEEEDSDPEITRTIERVKESINGHKTRLVTTTILTGENDRPLIIREWITRKNQDMESAERAFSKLDNALQREDEQFHGLPDFIEIIMNELSRKEDLETYDGYMVKAEIYLEDSDGDDVFRLNYDLIETGESSEKASFFKVPESFSRRD